MLMYIIKVLYIFEYLKLLFVGIIMFYKFGFFIWYMLIVVEFVVL